MSENNSIKAHGGVLVNRITKVDSTGLFSITILPSNFISSVGSARMETS